MYETKFVKKRKKKIAAAIASGVGATGVAALAIVAFLGRFVGTFTVKLTSNNVYLSLSEYADFRTEGTFLRVNELPKFSGEVTYSYFLDNDRANILDREGNDFSSENADKELQKLIATTNEDGKVESIKFLKYTWFIKNVGDTTASYNVAVNVTDRTSEEGGEQRVLDDILRVAIYEHDVNDPSHDHLVFAKRGALREIDIGGEKITTDKEFKSTPEYGLVDDNFVSVDQIVTLDPVREFRSGDEKRYTLIAWLEGEDPQAKGSAPIGASLKLGVEINAYEN